MAVTQVTSTVNSSLEPNTQEINTLKVRMTEQEELLSNKVPEITSIAAASAVATAAVTSNTTRQTALETTFEALVINAGSSNAEIVAARGSEVYLPDRLDGVDAQLAETATFHMSKTLGKLNNGENVVIVFLGDSTTEYNATTNGLPNHVGLLTTWLNGLYPGQITVINAGLSGDGARQMWKRSYKDVLVNNPDLIIVCTGVNDQGGANAVSLSTFRQNYENLIKNIIATSDCDIVLRTPNVVINPVDSIAIDVFNDVTRALAGKYKLGLYDLFKIMQADIENGIITLTVPAFMQDGVHPNENGHIYISEHFKPYFTPTNYVIEPLSSFKMINGSDGFAPRNTGFVEALNTNYMNGRVVSWATASRYTETCFYGSDFTVVFTGGTAGGQFIVYIDGVAQPLVDAYSVSTEYRMFANYSVPSGEHAIRIENQATKNAASAGYNIIIEGILFKKETTINENIIKPYGFALIAQTAITNLTASTNQTFLFNSVTDNADIVDVSLATGEITIKKTGLYDLLFSTTLTADADATISVGYYKNTVNQKTLKDSMQSGTGSKIKTIDFVETVELIAGDILKFYVNVGGVTPTAAASAGIRISKKL